MPVLDLTSSTPKWVLNVLGREEADIPLPEGLGRVLVTGASGSIGSSIKDTLRSIASDVVFTDIAEDADLALDVTAAEHVQETFAACRPEVVFHLAGAKHAPLGEKDPYSAMIVNTIGTKNVLEAGRHIGAKVIVASTCKACDPETAYGASKLIAERMALNEGQVVVRFYNVAETSGNVFEIWDLAVSNGSTISVAPCKRYFMSAKEAARLTLWASGAETGRYAISCANQVSMTTVARRVHPNVKPVRIPPRRGDRLKEPRMARSEQGVRVTKDIMRISSPHDPR